MVIPYRRLGTTYRSILSLGYYVASSGNSLQTFRDNLSVPSPVWVITQRVVVISCRHFGTTYLAHLPGSRILCLRMVYDVFSVVNNKRIVCRGMANGFESGRPTLIYTWTGCPLNPKENIRAHKRKSNMET